VCLRSLGRSSWRQLEVSATQIARVALRIGPFRGRVLVVAGGRTYRLLVPRAESYRLLNALSAIGQPAKEARSGVTATLMVRRVIDHVLALPAVALDPQVRRALPPAPSENPAVDERVHSLESELEELREQVNFLEQLLRQHHAEPAESERLGSG
jgi:hypothetical protein